MTKLGLLILGSAIVLAGCRLDGRVELNVTEDGSGTAVFEVGIDDELLEAAESFGAFDINQLVTVLGVTEDDGEVTERREGDMTFYRAERAFTSVSELEEIIGSFGGVDVGSIELQITNDGATFTGLLDPPEISATLGGVGLLDPTQLDETVSLNVDVSLPGTLGENDADEVLPDNTLRWAINLDGPTVMNASTSFGSSGFPTWLIAILAAGVVAIGGFLALGRNRDSRTAQVAVASAPPPDAPTSFDDD